jgi:hypothetical protein
MPLFMLGLYYGGLYRQLHYFAPKGTTINQLVSGLSKTFLLEDQGTV